MKKRGFFVLALVMMTAGVASAFAPISQPQDSARPPARDLAMPVVAPQPATALPAAAVPEPVVKKSEPVVKKASVEVRQAPVPLLMKPRPPIEQPAVDADAVKPEALAKASDVSGEGAAKAAIEADGYKGVKVLRQGVNGIWYARAMRGATEVPLTVDAAGRVSLE